MVAEAIKGIGKFGKHLSPIGRDEFPLCKKKKKMRDGHGEKKKASDRRMTS